MQEEQRATFSLRLAQSPDAIVHVGDVRECLAEMSDESVNCVVTSPPYWGLRDFGVPGQFGLEPTPEAYVENMVAVFREVRRVLRKDGTLWLNLGDSYGTGTAVARRRESLPPAGGPMPAGWSNRADLTRNGWAAKQLIGIPWRVAFALQADGWWLRSDIIWSKPNPMPESVIDRPTKAHEYLFLLTRSARYHYNTDAIRTPLRPKTFTTFGSLRHDPGDGSGLVKSENYGRDVPERKPRLKMPDGWDTSSGAHGSFHRNGREAGSYRESDLAGANARTVWTIATQAYPDAHFATFPEKLVEPCVKAGCPEGGIVLDPFVGSGTVLAVARRLGRASLGIELQPDYLPLIEDRLHGIKRKRVTQPS